MRRLFVYLVVLVAAAAAPAAAAERQYIGASSPKSADGLPFSRAVRVGDTLYLAGYIGLTEDRKLPADAETEARNALDGYKRTLAEAGMTMDDLVTVTVYCSDVSLYDTWNKIYRSYFTKEFPARAFVGSGQLLFGARFEIQGIALKR